MSLGHGSQIARDGLVFHYDMSNTQKSWKGAPTTNVVTNSNMTGGWSLSNFSGSSATLTYETEDGVPHLKITNVVLGSGSPDYPRITDTTFTQTITDGFSVSFEAKGTPGEVIKLSLYSTGSTKITLTATLTDAWQRYTFNNQTTGFTLNQPYIRFDTTMTGSVRYIRRIQVEQQLFATPFVTSVRSNTESIIDLTKNNTVTANSLTYAADGTFSFNGNTSYLVPNAPFTIWDKPFTISQWVYFLDDSRGILVGDFSTTSAINTAFEKHTDRRLRFYWDAAPDIFTANNVIDLNKWQYVTVVRDTATSQVRFYTNGNLVHTYNGALSNKIATVPHRIGADGRTGTTVVNGSIATTQIYDRALSAAEIAQNFEATRGRYGI